MLFLISSVQNILTCKRQIYDMFLQKRKAFVWKLSQLEKKSQSEGGHWRCTCLLSELLFQVSKNILCSILQFLHKKMEVAAQIKSVRIFYYYYFFSCFRTLGQDTWHVDKFTPPLGMIKLLTLDGPSNHPPSPAGWQSENHSVWEACLQPCSHLCNLTDTNWLWKKHNLFYIFIWYTMLGVWDNLCQWQDSVKLCCATVLGGFAEHHLFIVPFYLNV